MIPSHDGNPSSGRYVFYASDVGNEAYLGVLNLSTLQLSVRRVPQISDWTEMACDTTTYAPMPLRHRLRVHATLSSLQVLLYRH